MPQAISIATEDPSTKALRAQCISTTAVIYVLQPLSDELVTVTVSWKTTTLCADIFPSWQLLSVMVGCCQSLFVVVAYVHGGSMQIT